MATKTKEELEKENKARIEKEGQERAREMARSGQSPVEHPEQTAGRRQPGEPTGMAPTGSPEVVKQPASSKKP